MLTEMKITLSFGDLNQTGETLHLSSVSQEKKSTVLDVLLRLNKYMHIDYVHLKLKFHLNLNMQNSMLPLIKTKNNICYM